MDEEWIRDIETTMEIDHHLHSTSSDFDDTYCKGVDIISIDVLVFEKIDKDGDLSIMVFAHEMEEHDWKGLKTELSHIYDAKYQIEKSSAAISNFGSIVV